MTDKIATWGYSKDGPKLFQLAKGDKLPFGYVDSPAKVKEDKKPATRSKKAKK
jgi:hypothetical protein